MAIGGNFAMGNDSRNIKTDRRSDRDVEPAVIVDPASILVPGRGSSSKEIAPQAKTDALGRIGALLKTATCPALDSTHGGPKGATTSLTFQLEPQ